MASPVLAPVEAGTLASFHSAWRFGFLQEADASAATPALVADSLGAVLKRSSSWQQERREQHVDSWDWISSIVKRTGGCQL